MPFPAFRHLGALALCAALGLGQASFVRAADAQDYSEAERSLFMTNHLANVSPTTRWRFIWIGSPTATAAQDAVNS